MRHLGVVTAALLGRRLYSGELHERLAKLRRISRLLLVVRLPLRFARGRGVVALDRKIAEHDGLMWRSVRMNPESTTVTLMPNRCTS